MEVKLTPELIKLKEEFDFLHQKIGELEWELATKFYGKKAVFASELEMIKDRLENYRENMGMLIDKIQKDVHLANEANHTNSSQFNERGD